MRDEEVDEFVRELYTFLSDLRGKTEGNQAQLQEIDKVAIKVMNFEEKLHKHMYFISTKNSRRFK